MVGTLHPSGPKDQLGLGQLGGEVAGKVSPLRGSTVGGGRYPSILGLPPPSR
jgi:hypothetical protein